MKRLFPLRNIALVSFRIDKWISPSRLHPWKLLLHAEVAPMRSQKHIARQRLQSLEASLIILRNRGIGRIPHQLEPRIHIWTAHDHDVVRLVIFSNPYRPRCAALCVPCSLMCNQHNTAQLHLVPVVQHAIHLRGRIVAPTEAPYWKSVFPPDSTTGTSASITMYFRSSQSFDLRTPGSMIPMGMADQEYLHILEVEPQRLHIFSDLRNTAHQTAVDQYQSLGRSDQIRREVLAANVIDTPDDAKRRMRRGPFGRILRKGGAKKDERQQKGAKEHSKE